MIDANGQVDFTRFLSQPRTPRVDQAGVGDAALRQVTREFEALFIKQMLDAMNNTLKPEDGLFYGGQAEKVFQDMLTMERARDLSFDGAFGIADAMYDQLSRNRSAAAYEAQQP